MQANALDDLQTQQKSCEQVKVDLNTIQGQIQFAEIEKQKVKLLWNLNRPFIYEIRQ